MTRALNALRRTEVEKANAEKLIHTIEIIPELRAWIGAHRFPARAADRLHRTLHEDAPKLRSALSSWFRQRQGAEPVLYGRWNLERDLDKAEILFAAAAAQYGEHPAEQVFALSAKAIRHQLDELLASITYLKTAYRCINASANFFSQAGIATLVALSRSRAAPMDFKVVHTATAVTLQTDKERWIGSIAIKLAEAVPH